MKFNSKNQLLFLTAVILFSFLGCVAVEVGPIPEGSNLFQKGYKDGANSGLVAAGNKYNKWAQDHKLFSSDIDYKRGWEEGFFKNIGELKTSEKTDRAISLLNLDNKIYEAQIINYFSLKPHKAFAINPLIPYKKYQWCYDYKSTSAATNHALKKCGIMCTLFAEENDIVWEQKLEEWEKNYIGDKNNFTKKLDKHGNTIFHYVIWYGKYKYANRLIEKGADINIRNKFDATALLVGAENGNFDSVQFLIDNDADINKPNIHNETPLFAAAAKGYPGIVKLLIENGADVNMTAQNGNSPIDIAKANGHNEVIVLLIKHGAK